MIVEIDKKKILEEMDGAVAGGAPMGTAFAGNLGGSAPSSGEPIASYGGGGKASYKKDSFVVKDAKVK